MPWNTVCCNMRPWEDEPSTTTFEDLGFNQLQRTANNRGCNFRLDNFFTNRSADTRSKVPPTSEQYSVTTQSLSNTKIQVGSHSARAARCPRSFVYANCRGPYAPLCSNQGWKNLPSTRSATVDRCAVRCTPR